MKTNIPCPNPHCFKGSVDTGGFTPWGAPITNVCPTCAGHAFVDPDEIPQPKEVDECRD
jgi:hypothetical protein